MSKQLVDANDVTNETLKALSTGGCLLLAGDKEVNPMTIGWGTIGPIWGKSIFMVMVRPSRHTFDLMEKATTFSVNVPNADSMHACRVCGTQSGRDVNKVELCELTIEPGQSLDVPTIAECPIHYECKIVHSSPLAPKNLDKEIIENAYGGGDFHHLYWGEITGIFRTTD